jgi:hypothetical protein
MAITRNQGTTKKYYAGIDLALILGVNCTPDQIQKIYGMDSAPQERVYLKESSHKFSFTNGEEETVDTTELMIEFILKGSKTDKIQSLPFRIHNTFDRSKSGIPCWVNQFGKTIYADSKENLPSWFTKKSWKDKKTGSDKGFDVIFRQAYVGERNLYSFLRTIMGAQFSEFNQENNLLLTEKAFSTGAISTVKEINEVFNDRKVAVVFEVDAKYNQETAETNYYQKINPYSFLSYEDYKIFNIFMVKNFEGMEKPQTGRDKFYDIRYFVESLKIREEKKEQVLLRNIQEFDPTESPNNSNDTVITDTDSEY